ncbi:hypothetical protein ETD86_38710 [Nonomuraea turkmeniaca]|uniref:Serine/threonine protein kinase n=1 Tax=Nonomuraea turkmeniaca TaxID=103838 RepID=A0A5S4F3F9_9ACTN|nr:hypothetical protein [Nonomuraea turkmeniaca]TMR10668.1 hypothetical protein ETD86_38710 [Nonomuraea turkmeniaca]
MSAGIDASHRGAVGTLDAAPGGFSHGREVDGWNEGRALQPHDYLGGGRPLGDVVRAAGPVRGEALHRLALGSATAMARLHLAGIAGLRLHPGNVMIEANGQVYVAPGPRDSEFPSRDVRDWADVIVFAAAGRRAGEGEEPDLDRLLPAVRAVIDECRQADPGSRPTAVELVSILLGHSAAVSRASVDDLLREAENRLRPYEPPPYEATLVPTPLWRKPVFLAGTAIGVSIVAAAAVTVVMTSGSAREPDWRDVLGAIDRRTATFQVAGDGIIAEGRFSFDPDAATAYEMRLTCGNAPQAVDVSIVGDRGVAAGVPFDVARPQFEPCAQMAAASVRGYTSPHTIKALIDAAGTDVSVAPEPGGGLAISGTTTANPGAGPAGSPGRIAEEGPVAFELRLAGDGLPVRLRLQTKTRAQGSTVVETAYRDWREFEAVTGRS